MRNNIDKYFKENLNVPQNPPKDAWDFIQNNIPKEEKKRIVPFWFRLSGIAVAFLFLLGGGILWYVNPDFISNSKNDALTQSNINSTESSDTQNNLQDTTNQNENLSNIENSEFSNDFESSQYKFDTKNLANHENSHGNSGQKSMVKKLANKISNYFNSDNNEILSIQTNYFNQSNEIFDANSLNSEDFEDSERNDLAKIDSNWNSEIPIFNSKTVEISPLEESILQPENSTEELILAKNKVEDKKKNSKNDFKKKIEFDRFHVSGFISPMALNTFVGKSMLSEEMSQYKTENNLTLAYGIKGGYAVTPKLILRTGLSVVGFEQITKNVPLAANVSGSPAAAFHNSHTNVNYEGPLRISTTYMATLAGSEMNDNTTNGNIQQQTQYFEIPVEAELSLVQTNSIGISATAGGSTWLLTKNKIYAHTDDFTEELGKADNLNKTSFSANAGLKFDMKLSEKVKINVEPGFKYLINSVSDNENFNPYTVGVNAGVSVSLK